MRNRPDWFIRGSAGRWPVMFGGSPNTVFSAGRRKVHASRVRSPEIGVVAFFIAVTLGSAASVHAQEASPTPSPGGAEAEQVVISATRFDVPRDQSPASVSVISSDDLEQKQIERVSDALREVPGLSVVQTGTPGQLTSVFTRGLNSAHTQVLLDGIPINQGLAGQFDFANLTTDNIERIEVVRGPQSTIYGPRALAGVIQIFTKRGDGTPGITLSGEGGSYDTFRESFESDGKKTDAKVEVTTVVHEAPSSDVIAEEAKKGYDLMVIGLEKTTSRKSEFHESVTGIALGFDGPLMVTDVRGDLEKKPGEKLNILVPVNGTDVARRGAEVAITMARANEASITVLYVAARNGKGRRGRNSRSRQHEEAILKDIVAIADGYNMSVRTAVLADRAADEAILREVERHKHNLVVVGVGRRPGDKLFFGDTAAALLEKSKNSLLFLAS